MRLAALWLCAIAAAAQPGNVLVVVNENDSLSRRIGNYYLQRRAVPAANLCRLRASTEESIPWETYRREVERPVAACLELRGLRETVLYIVVAMGVPLRIFGPGEGPATANGAVDSELALLYAKMRGSRFPEAGAVPNPFFGRAGEAFAHPRFPIYLVTRLAGYDFQDVRALVDRALAARNRGRFVIDLSAGNSGEGDEWLRTAAILLPENRVLFDDTEAVLYDRREVIGYAGWGSNDRHRTHRFLGFHWLPGAIVTEFVSTNGRTFRQPPDSWTFSSWHDFDRPRWFAGSPQSLTADYIREGATGCSGHVYEPFLSHTPRPDYLLPAYFRGRNLAESYYLAIPSLSWQNIVVGDPLCSLGKPSPGP